MGRKKVWLDENGVNRTTGTASLVPWQATCTALISACVGPAINGPADVIKTRLMASPVSDSASGALAHHQPQYKGLVDAAFTIYRTEGLAGYTEDFGHASAELRPDKQSPG